MKKKLIIVSGYFNPLHKGHIEYFHLSKQNGDKLIVIINNDTQRMLKGSKEFMKEKERQLIVSEMKIVDYTILSVDKDKTVCETLEIISLNFSSEFDLFFANGGDQVNEKIPEADICKKLKITMIDGLGKKIQSSSWLLNK
jgi:D-beta-D-heptose 7-phosphate kinase/D-beta-D-heptose 1-phosphate adenosyltransferase